MGCMLLLAITVERILVIKSRLKPTKEHCPTGLETELTELKGYTHGSIHELRNEINATKLNLEAKSAGISERLARLEAKTDASAAQQVEMMHRVLRLIEGKGT